MNAITMRLSKLLDRIHPSETAVLFVTAVIVGGGTGLGAVLFIKLIALVQVIFFQSGASVLGFLGNGLLILAPAVGGLLAGPIIAYFAKEAKGHGVPEVMQAIALRGGRMRPRVVVAKVIASALCIGSGGSAGREGPIVQVGSALGSTVGQWLHLTDARIRNLVACGAAAGIAATFNAPIAGVVFAMEIILGELHLGEMGNVIIAAVTSSTIARIFLGDNPAFTIPAYSVKSPWEILLYMLLGILAGLAAVGFIRLLYGFEHIFDSWRFPDALKPAVGGLALGLLAFLYPLGLRLPSRHSSVRQSASDIRDGFRADRKCIAGWSAFLPATGADLPETAGNLAHPGLRQLGRCVCTVPVPRSGAGRRIWMGGELLVSGGDRGSGSLCGRRYGRGVRWRGARTLHRHPDRLRDDQRLSPDPATDGRRDREPDHL